jgi:hypothetical protein
MLSDPGCAKVSNRHQKQSLLALVSEVLQRLFSLLLRPNANAWHHAVAGGPCTTVFFWLAYCLVLVQIWRTPVECTRKDQPKARLSYERTPTGH